MAARGEPEAAREHAQPEQGEQPEQPKPKRARNTYPPLTAAVLTGLSAQKLSALKHHRPDDALLKNHQTVREYDNERGPCDDCGKVFQQRKSIARHKKAGQCPGKRPPNPEHEAKHAPYKRQRKQ